MKKTVIVDGLRTPFGKYKGALKNIRPDDLAAIVIQNLVERNKISYHLRFKMNIFEGGHP